jgi:hypothetical protein
VCKNGPRDLTMNSSDENYFQTNTRTFVLFRINTLPRPAPFSQLPTRSGGANRQCLFSIHLYTYVYNSCTRRRILYVYGSTCSCMEVLPEVLPSFRTNKCRNSLLLALYSHSGIGISLNWPNEINRPYVYLRTKVPSELAFYSTLYT